MKAEITKLTKFRASKIMKKGQFCNSNFFWKYFWSKVQYFKTSRSPQIYLNFVLNKVLYCLNKSWFTIGISDSSFLSIFSDPPSITKKPSNGLYKAHKGDDVFLSCEGKGTPEPTITWTRMVSIGKPVLPTHSLELFFKFSAR